MARDATRFSRISVGFADSVNSLPAVDAGDTGAVFSVTGPAVFDGNTLPAISSTTVAFNFGSIAAFDSSSLTAALANAADGDTIIATPGSTWSGAYFDLAITANVQSAGVVEVALVNSTNTAINPNAATFRLTRMAF